MSTQEDTGHPTAMNLNEKAPGLKRLLIGVSWLYEAEPDAPVADIDLSCFLLGRDGQTREDEDFVFYNNPQGAALAVKLLGDNRTGLEDTDDRVMMIDLDNLSFDVWNMMFVVSIYNGSELDQNLGRLRGLTLRAENADTGEELHRITTPTTYPKAAALKVAELAREGVSWTLKPVLEPVEAGLSEVAKSYGILVSSTT